MVRPATFSVLQWPDINARRSMMELCCAGGLLAGIGVAGSARQGLARAVDRTTRVAAKTGRRRRIVRLSGQGTKEKFSATTIEPRIGCDPVCVARPDWNTTVPPVGV